MGETPPAGELEVATHVMAGDGAGPDEQLTAALANAQATFPVIEKKAVAEVRGKDGKPGYSYTYADVGDVLAAVRPVLARNGLAVTQPTERNTNGNSGWVLRTVIRHVGGGTLESEVDLGQAPSNPQAFGGALTYLRRYELCTLLGIAAEEDRDAQDVPIGGRERPPELPAWAQEATDDRKADLLHALTPIIGHQRAIGLCKATSETFGAFPDMIVGFVKGLATHHASAQREPGERPVAAPATASPPPGDEPREAPVADSAAEPESAEATAPEGLEPGTVEPEHEDAAKLCICPQGLDTPEIDRVNECPILGHGVPF